MSAVAVLLPYYFPVLVDLNCIKNFCWFLPELGVSIGSDINCYKLWQLWVQPQSPAIQVSEGVCLSPTILQ